MTNDERVAARIRSLRAHGTDGTSPAEYAAHTSLGLNSRLDALQATVLGVKARHLAEWNLARAHAAARYRDLLAPLHEHLKFPAAPTKGVHVYNQFVLRTEHRDAL